MTTPPRILLDCDPGIDDAFALLCALRFTELAAITTVSGNVSINNTTRNARYLMDLAGADVPVHRGASTPLLVEGVAADEIHGSSGLGNLATPDSEHPESGLDAVDAILQYCADGDATVVATGPLTNIARALQKDPSLPERISHLYWMGGGTEGGNVTDRAEFNAWVDPHALDITLRSGISLTMFGLNLTHQVLMGQPEIDALRAARTSTSSVLADFLEFYRENGARHVEGQPMHDPCALLGLTHPDLFETTKSHIVTSTIDDEDRGRTFVHEPQTNVEHYVAVRADAPRVIDLIVQAAINPTPVA